MNSYLCRGAVSMFVSWHFDIRGVFLHELWKCKGYVSGCDSGGLSICLFSFLSVSWTATAAPICVCALFSLVLNDYTGARSWQE